MFITNTVTNHATSEHHRNERKQRKDAAEERSRELTIELTLQDAEGLTVEGSNRKKRRDTLKSLEKTRLAEASKAEKQERVQQGKVFVSSRFSKGPELEAPKSYAGVTERAPEKSAQKSDVKKQEENLVFAKGTDSKTKTKEQLLSEGLPLDGKAPLSKKNKAATTAQLQNSALVKGKEEKPVMNAPLSFAKEEEMIAPSLRQATAGEEIEETNAQDKALVSDEAKEESVLFDTAEDESTLLSMNQTQAGKANQKAGVADEDINQLYRNLMENEGNEEKETLLASNLGIGTKAMSEDPTSERDLFPMLRQVSNSNASKTAETSSDEISDKEIAKLLSAGSTVDPKTLPIFQGNLASLLANVLSLEMQISSQYWSMLYNSASRSMSSVLKMAPMVASLMRQAYDAQAEALSNNAAEERASAIANFTMFGISAIASAVSLPNDPDKDKDALLSKTDANLMDDAKNKAGSSAGLSGAGGFTSYMKTFGKWAAKTAQISQGMSLLSMGTTSAYKAYYEAQNAGLKSAEGNAQAAEKEMDYFLQYHQSAYQRYQDLYQGAQSFIDQCFNLWTQACDSLAQAMNQLFRG